MVIGLHQEIATLVLCQGVVTLAGPEPTLLLNALAYSVWVAWLPGSINGF